MTDFFGTALAVGDRVAFIETGYRNLKIGEVIGLTAQKVRIRHAAPRWEGDKSGETQRFPSEVIKG